MCDALAWDEENKKLQVTKHTDEEEGRAENKPRSGKVYLYIVMQLCQRESLKSWLRSCTYQRVRRQSTRMFREICSGVEYVHSQGLIHRDLKPGNIFFSADGTIKVTNNYHNYRTKWLNWN